MTNKVFVDNVTIIDAAWLNDVNTTVNTTLPAETAARIAADALLAPLASPALTGTPTAPTAAPGTNTTQVATTAYSTAADTVILAAAVAASVPRTASTGSAVLPSGTTAQRDGTPNAGYTRFNSDFGKGEIYNGTSWSGLGGATGAGGDSVFYENGQTVTTNYTLTTNTNAMTAGPITIANGVTVTVPTGATWTVV